jgi:hypothetical protein
MGTLRKRDEWPWNTRRWNLHTKRSKHRDQTEERDRYSGGDGSDALHPNQSARVIYRTSDQSARCAHNGV